MSNLRKSIFAALAVGLACLATHAAIAATSAQLVSHGHGGCNCGCESCNNGCSCSGNGGCGKFDCGCQGNTHCEPTMTTKKVEEVCWVCECKMVCMAGPSCGCQGTCGMSRQVKHLVRKTITHEVPVVKCNAVEGAACSCGASTASPATTTTPDAPMPAAPAPPAAQNSPFSIDAFTLSNPASMSLSSRRTN